MKEIDVILDDHTILVNIGTVQSSELYMQINTGMFSSLKIQIMIRVTKKKKKKIIMIVTIWD